MSLRRAGYAGLIGSLLFAAAAAEPAEKSGGRRASALLLKPADYRHYVDRLPDADTAWPWLAENVPLFECSDRALEEIYYFRWYTFHRHIKPTPDGYVITEFQPDVRWAGKQNTISCAAGHHFYEGRWLRDRRYLRDYALFWFRKGGEPRRYSFWAADAIRAWSMVTHDLQLAVDLYPDLAANYAEWERTHLDANGLFWQIDDRDGMEYSIGGSGYRPTINSYMYGDAVALGEIAQWAKKPGESFAFRMKAAALRERVEDLLWDRTADFYKTLPRGAGRSLADVRELAGYVPWYFGLPHPGREAAWKQLLDRAGFAAPYGPGTAERRHPRYRFANPHECLWNGPSWPYATAQALTAMANLLNQYRQAYVTKADYLDLLRTYARSQHLRQPDGTVVPWIDENLDPDTGEWLARGLLAGMPPERQAAKGGQDRGRDYNHSTFNDLVITGLVGLRPRMDEMVEIHPLVPEAGLDYFCLDGVRYHDFDLTVLWDRDGRRYGRGKGLRVFANGREVASRAELGWLSAPLPNASAGWRKAEQNPLIGGKWGTVFDVAVLRDGDRYRMWGSWRPKKGIALFESPDGIHWSDPELVFGPTTATRWESDINRPAIVKRADGYHMWYTGQASGHSAIGYARSPDGRTWTRIAAAPVLTAELPWEKVAVMCPHVIWDETARLFRMWYSGGEQYEPDAIGYATSADGIHWRKHGSNPVFRPSPQYVWEQDRVTGAQVMQMGEWFYMFYIGFRDVNHAQIGVARSRDGITGWERHPLNPIIRPGQDSFDQDACYKPFAIFDGRQWLLWYNGRHGTLEQIALATLSGSDLGFGK